MRFGRRTLAIMASAAAVAAAIAPAAAADSPPGPGVHAVRSREICHLPRSGNPQGVLGFDVGSSIKDSTGQVLWFFGDTFIDSNKSGVFDNGAAEFRTGTIARTTDLNPLDCVDMTWKKSSGKVVNMIQPRSGAPLYECLTWPMGAVDIDGTTYVYVRRVHKSPQCGQGDEDGVDPASWYTTGLIRVTNPTTLETANVADLWGRGEEEYANPLMIGGYVYLFGTRLVDHGWIVTQEILLSRVAKAGITDVNAYEYHDGIGWNRDKHAAKPIYGDAFTGPKSVSYNKYLDRYLMVYGCNFTQICARTTVNKGRQASALWSGWNPGTVLVSCAGDTWSCHHAFQHPEYSPNDSRLYVTAARHEGPHYWVTLHEVDIATFPAPFSRDHVEPHADFYVPNRQDDEGRITSVQGREGWSYVSWPSRDPLTWESIVRPFTRPDGRVEQIVCSRAWVGAETTDPPRPRHPVCADVVERVPRVYTTGSQPGITQDVARVWTARNPGTVSFSGEAWVERTCGDGVTLEISKLSGATTTVLHTVRLKAKWAKKRAQRIDTMAPVTVAAGDQLVFAIDGGAQTGMCDRTYFNPTMTFDQHSLAYSAMDDFRDNPAQGFRGWRYQRCPLVDGVPSGCLPLAWDKANNVHVDPFGGSATVRIVRMTPPVDPALAVARSWSAPAAGRAVVDGRLIDVETGAGCAGDDGVLAAVFLDDTKLWPAAPDWATVDAGRSPRIDLELSVEAGSSLQFLVRGGADSACDDTRLNADIRFTW